MFSTYHTELHLFVYGILSFVPSRLWKYAENQSRSPYCTWIGVDKHFLRRTKEYVGFTGHMVSVTTTHLWGCTKVVVNMAVFRTLYLPKLCLALNRNTIDICWIDLWTGSLWKCSLAWKIPNRWRGASFSKRHQKVEKT